MIRRTFLVAIAAGGLAACDPPSPISYAPPPSTGAPPAFKIQRLLVWLPPATATDVRVRETFSTKTVRLFDTNAFGAELKKQFEAHGVQVLIATSSGFELNRADEQKGLRDRFKPTHRFEVDVSNVASESTTRYATSQQATVKWALYEGQESKPVRAGLMIAFSAREDAIPTADRIVDRLVTQGFL